MLPVISARSRVMCASWLAYVLLACLAPRSSAQQAPTEFRTQSISVFGGFLYDTLAFGPGSATGFSAGLDLTHYFRRIPVEASLEGRANVASGTGSAERSYTFGPRLQYRLGRYRPYGEFEVGAGNIHFGTLLVNELGYDADRSTIFAGGGGVDIDLRRNLAAEIDVQGQRWDTAPQVHQVFTPILVTIGLHYTLPFRSFIRGGDPHYH